ncbi:MAG: TerB family tellurite resistance protein [Flavobacteriia bacterium]|nr:TerB family tellurite resistance protein [Flavobacteriia bacterium]
MQQLILNIQKLAQFKKILTQIKDGYQILNGGYNNIKNIAQGNYNIHKQYLDGLLNVSPTVRNYQRVSKIINYQMQLIGEYKRAYSRFVSSGNFSPEELAYMAMVYDNLLSQSLRDLDELVMILTSGKTRMSDDERLETIDRLFFEMEDKLAFLREFNNSASVMDVQRSHEKQDVQSVRSLYGIKK